MPRITLGVFGWETIDPVTARLVGAALMGIGIESFLGRNAGIESFRGMLTLMLIWSFSAVFGIGLSLVEISHRSKEFVSVMENARSLVKELLNLPKGYTVLFLQGGASTQFLMAPLNLSKLGGKAAYLDTGVWSTKAIKEAKLFGEIEVVVSSKDTGYNSIPKNFEVPLGVDYVHLTSNNTIYGTQFKEFPKNTIYLISEI